MRSNILALTSCGLVVIAGAVVASAAVASEVPQHASQAETSIIVEPGDTIYAIGRKYGVAPADLIAANNIAPPYQLQVGQAIILPDMDNMPAEAVAMATKKAEPKITGGPAPEAIETAEMTSTDEVKAVNVSATTSPVREEHMMTPAVERLDALYTVRAGDTMYSLARRFELPLEELAATNEIASPYTLSVGQRIVIPGAVTAEVVRPAADPAPAPAPVETAAVESTGHSEDARLAARELGVMNAVAEKEMSADEGILISKSSDSRFAWPIRGSVIENYGRNDAGVRNDGINIAAPIGAPIRASADGEVIYTGAELEGYGNLLLVRHDDGWVSAYAHADSIVVKKGDRVRQGQVVAKVGRTGSVAQPQLHFELRHDLQPRDPLAALEGRDLKAVAIN